MNQDYVVDKSAKLIRKLFSLSKMTDINLEGLEHPGPAVRREEYESIFPNSNHDAVELAYDWGDRCAIIGNNRNPLTDALVGFSLSGRMPCVVLYTRSSSKLIVQEFCRKFNKKMSQDLESDADIRLLSKDTVIDNVDVIGRETPLIVEDGVTFRDYFQRSATWIQRICYEYKSICLLLEMENDDYSFLTYLYPTITYQPNPNTNDHGVLSKMLINSNPKYRGKRISDLLPFFNVIRI